MMECQKIEFTSTESYYLIGQIDRFFSRPITGETKGSILDLLAGRYLLRAKGKLARNTYPWANIGKTKFKVSFTPEEIISVYAAIPIQEGITPMPAVVAYGKFQQKALNYDQVINLKK